jgi:DNA-binding MarR family transcriptional regulator
VHLPVQAGEKQLAQGLELIFAPAPLSPGELAAAAGLTTGGVTTAIDRLERAGYATRVRDTRDRRRVTVQPTDKSYAIINEIFAPIFEEGAAYLRQFDVPTLRRMTGFMRFAAQQQETHAARLADRE